MLTIKKKTDTDSYILEVSGRIDSSNASQLDEALKEAYTDTNKVSLDFEGVDYISSSGLRALFSNNKKPRKLIVFNVKNEVYDIFDMTGFNQMLEVRKQLSTIDIEGLPEIGHGATAVIYRLNDEQVVKVFAPTVSIDLIENEFSSTKTAFTMGVPTVIPFEIARSGDSYAIVYELLHAIELPDYIHRYPEKKDEYIQRYIDFVKSLKNIEVKESFPSMKDNYHALIDAVAHGLEKTEVKLYHDLINRIPDGNSFVHGDCHMGNIMVQDGELLLIDMATVGYGDPIFELFNVYSPYMFIPTALPPEAVLNMLSLSCEECGMVWDHFWADYSKGWPEEKKAEVLRSCELFSTMKGVINCIMLPGLAPEEYINELKARIIEGARNI